jgi:endonuclease G
MSGMKKSLLLFFILLISLLKAQNYALPYSAGFASHNGYFYEYSPQHQQVKWVAYKLRGMDVKKALDPEIKFFNDPKLPSNAIGNEDFIQRAFAAGHLKPSGDSRACPEDMHDAFLYANICPMKPTFDQFTWNILENTVRSWAYIYDSIFVISGPVFKDPEKIDTIGLHKIPVPDYFFKAVLVYNGIDMDAIGYAVPNVDTKDFTKLGPITIDSLEKFTGLDLFYLLPEYLENHLESKVNPLFWQGQNNSYALKISMRRREIQCLSVDALDNRCSRPTLALNGFCQLHGGGK